MFDRLAPEKYGAVDEELQSLKKSADMWAEKEIERVHDQLIVKSADMWAEKEIEREHDQLIIKSADMWERDRERVSWFQNLLTHHNVVKNHLEYSSAAFSSTTFNRMF